MGCMMHDAFVRFDEFKAGFLDEREFVQAARALKAAARGMGRDSGPVIDAFVHHGLDAAFALLQQGTLLDETGPGAPPAALH